ncbi:MAG: electron transfer flavoprotein subunit alpha/FixB family protein [Myxococcota bacterium]
MPTNILVFCETEGGQPRKSAFELLGKAAQLAAATGGSVSAVVLGETDTNVLGSWGASKVYVASGPAFGTYVAGAWVKALAAAIAASGANVVLGSAGGITREAFPRLSARLGAGLAVECTDLRAEGGAIVGRRPVYAGKALVDVKIKSPVALFTVRPNSFPIGAAPGGSATVFPFDAGVTDADLDVTVTETLKPATQAVDLTEADRIVSGGRSLKSKESFDAIVRPLAKAAHATPGASRAAVDAGFAPHGDQVGQTGKVVNPSLYIALGISGAIQHLAGMRTSRVIVAVNKDAEAPIFQYATYGYVGDLFEFAPAFQKELEKALA